MIEQTMNVYRLGQLRTKHTKNKTYNGLFWEQLLWFSPVELMTCEYCVSQTECDCVKFLSFVFENWLNKGLMHID